MNAAAVRVQFIEPASGLQDKPTDVTIHGKGFGCLQDAEVEFKLHGACGCAAGASAPPVATAVAVLLWCWLFYKLIAARRPQILNGDMRLVEEPTPRMQRKRPSSPRPKHEAGSYSTAPSPEMGHLGPKKNDARGHLHEGRSK